MIVRRMAIAVGMAGLFVLGSTGSAMAHDCFNTQKAAGSGGTVGTYDEASDTFTPSGKNGAFVEIVFMDGTSGFVFIHSAAGNDGVVPGAKNCDGKGLDSFTACMGG